MTKEELLQKGMDWAFNQGPSTVLLICVWAFLAVDKVQLQPERDRIQREAYAEFQEKADASIKHVLEVIDQMNEKWREALLKSKGMKMSGDDPVVIN